MDWSHLPFLLATVRGGSQAAAARALGVDPATVGRHVSALEREVGGKVLRRRRDGRLEPTDLGAQLVAAATRTEEAFVAAARVARADGEGVHGVVRLTTTDVLATHWVVPRLAGLADRHPDLVVEIVATPQLLDLTRDVDVALRLARPRETGLVARRAGVLVLGAYATPALARRVRAPGLPIVAYAEHFLPVPENAWIAGLERPRVVLRTTSVSAAMVAARAGLGVAMLPHLLTAGSGLLAIPELGETSREIWLALHPDLAKAPRVRAVADALVDGPRRRRS